MKPIKVRIKDIEWIFELMNQEDYEEKNGKDSQGITIKDKLKVEFSIDHFSLSLIRHELMHVYFSSCCIGSTGEMTVDDYEEIAAEIIEFHGEDICRTSKKIFNTLKLEYQND